MMQRSDYAFHPLSWEQYQAIIASGSFPNVPEPMLNRPDYDSLIAVLQPVNIDPRLALAFTWAEGHDGTDPSLVAASVNNLGGIKFSGAPDTYDSKIPADTGGTYAGFPDLTAYWQEWVRVMNNSIIGPSFNSGDLVGAVEHYTNGPGTGHNKVDKFLEYRAAYPAQGGAMTIYGSAVVAAAMKHLGDMHEYDTWNGDHAVSMYCEADIEDWHTEAGIAVPHYGSAAEDGDAGPLNGGHAPAGAKVFFRGSGWSVFDHVGVSLGDGRTISGLTSVVISPGWQDLPTYRGWRFADGVVADATQNVFYIDGSPYPNVPLLVPFWNRWHALDTLGLALPMMGFAMSAERTLPNGRRVQQFERGWYGTQPAPDPWDVVQLLSAEAPK